MTKYINKKSIKVLFVISSFAILIFSLLPGSQLPNDLPWDKAMHFVGYAGLAFLARYGSAKHPSWQLVIGCILFSIIIELLQLIVPNRSFEWMDILANSLGVLSGLLLAVFLKHIDVKESH